MTAGAATRAQASTCAGAGGSPARRGEEPAAQTDATSCPGCAPFKALRRGPVTLAPRWWRAAGSRDRMPSSSARRGPPPSLTGYAVEGDLRRDHRAPVACRTARGAEEGRPGLHRARLRRPARPHLPRDQRCLERAGPGAHAPIHLRRPAGLPALLDRGVSAAEADQQAGELGDDQLALRQGHPRRPLRRRHCPVPGPPGSTTRCARGRRRGGGRRLTQRAAHLL
jgi:hypothetical protein